MDAMIAAGVRKRWPARTLWSACGNPAAVVIDDEAAIPSFHGAAGTAAAATGQARDRRSNQVVPCAMGASAETTRLDIR